MKKPEKPQDQGRRGFLKMASVGSVAGAAAAAVGTGMAEAAEVQSDRQARGYRETAHVRKVYDLARF